MLNKKTLRESALKSGMDEKTVRKYRSAGELLSELKEEHTWRTRTAPIEDIWEEVRQMLSNEPTLKAVTIFGYLQGRNLSRIESLLGTDEGVSIVALEAFFEGLAGPTTDRIRPTRTPLFPATWC